MTKQNAKACFDTLALLVTDLGLEAHKNGWDGAAIVRNVLGLTIRPVMVRTARLEHDTPQGMARVAARKLVLA